MMLGLFGEKPAVTSHCRTFFLQPMPRFEDILLFFFIPHYDATTCATKTDCLWLLAMQPELAVTAHVTPVLPFSGLLIPHTELISAFLEMLSALPGGLLAAPLPPSPLRLGCL
jgi:hypothetical protein